MPRQIRIHPTHCLFLLSCILGVAACSSRSLVNMKDGAAVEDDDDGSDNGPTDGFVPIFPDADPVVDAPVCPGPQCEEGDAAGDEIVCGNGPGILNLIV